MKNITLYAGSEAALVEKRDELRAKGVVVTDIVDNDWSKSIYFQRPQRPVARVLWPAAQFYPR